MKTPIFPALVAAMLALPAVAQDAPTEPDRGRNLIEDGVQSLLRGLLSEIEPRMRDFAEEVEPQLRGFAEELAPLAEDLADLMEDLRMYEAPERLPNGDIIIRRKRPDAAPRVERSPEVETGPVDL